MDELAINKKHLNTLKLIIDAYKRITPIPKRNEWKKYTDNQLWLRHIGQIMVAGGSASKQKFDKRPDLQQMVNFHHLNMLNDRQLAQRIHAALMAAGVRFVGPDITKSSKTRALAYNYRFISEHPDGFIGLMKSLSQFTSNDAELERIGFLMKNLKFMKSKSARDFLMGTGMNVNTLAIDVRLRNVFAHVGLDFPVVNVMANVKTYNKMEQEIISKICGPLELKPVVFDRILYLNYSKIMHSDYVNHQLF
jgi:hypothetical protein